MKTKSAQRLAALATVLLLAAGCGSSSESGSEELPTLTDEAAAASSASDTEEVSEADQEKAFAEFEACMTEYGVDVSFSAGGGSVEVPGEQDAPTDGFENMTPEKMEEASAACDPILEDAFGSFELSPEQEAEQADMMLEMQQCLAEEGFEIDLTGNSFALPANVDPTELDAAMTKCNGQAGFMTDELDS